MGRNLLRDGMAGEVCFQESVVRGRRKLKFWSRNQEVDSGKGLAMVHVWQLSFALRTDDVSVSTDMGAQISGWR